MWKTPSRLIPGCGHRFNVGDEMEEGNRRFSGQVERQPVVPSWTHLGKCWKKGISKINSGKAASNLKCAPPHLQGRQLSTCVQAGSQLDIEIWGSSTSSGHSSHELECDFIIKVCLKMRRMEPWRMAIMTTLKGPEWSGHRR